MHCDSTHCQHNNEFKNELLNEPLMWKEEAVIVPVIRASSWMG
jgi:hypothetical protein